jgi:thiol-disulfide isomerase/thioredoxin
MMKRRAWLGATVMAATTGAVGGWVFWRHQTQARDHAAAAWWASTFLEPNGGVLVPAKWRGQPLLLNFWAPWCLPCVQELPLLDQFYREHVAKRWQVLGVAIDAQRPVQAFLARHPVSFPVGLAGLEGVDLARALGNPSGALPFTVVFDSAGAVVAHKLGILKSEDLLRWAQAIS